MLLAQKGAEIPKYLQHKPTLSSRTKKTVAMYFVLNKRIPPEEWRHDPTICDCYGNTVAMIFAIQKMKVPKEWYHDPELKN